MVFVFHKSIILIIFFITIFISSSHAHTFQVGGKDGWTLHPSENYNTWSSRLRFLINDTLHFKYDGGSDSVLVVNKSDYDGCNANNPITKLAGGDSSFKFDRSGPFYFITGNKSNCDQGQKLTVVVLALRNRSPPPSIATPPSSSVVPPSPVPQPPMSPVSPPSISPVSPPSPVPQPPMSPVSPPSMSPVSPPSIGGSPLGSPIGSPESSPFGAPVLSPPTPSPEGGSADSPGGGSAPSPTGGAGGPSPEGNAPGASAITPSPSAAPPLSGIVITSLVSMMFVLWGVN